jgi:hypothetical protein
MKIELESNIKISVVAGVWKAEIETNDTSSGTKVRIETSGNKNINDCLHRLHEEFKIMLSTYKEIYAIKG